MANIRDLKRSIVAVCDDLATDALIASVAFGDKVDAAKIDGIINEIMALQQDTLALTKISFDRSVKSFASKKEYADARRRYFKLAFTKLQKDFLDRSIEITKQLNDAVPEEVRKVISA